MHNSTPYFHIPYINKDIERGKCKKRKGRERERERGRANSNHRRPEELVEREKRLTE